MSAPRVAHACLRYPPGAGGVERYVQDLVERQRARGGNVTVATSRLRTHRPPEALPAAALRADPPHVHRLPHRPTPGLPYPRLPGMAALLDRLDPQILHGHAFWYHAADAAARWARRRGVPFLLHPHYSEGEKRRSAAWRLYRRTVGDRTFRAADAVVVVSPPEQAMIERAGLPARRFVLLPPSIDAARFEKPGPDPFRARGISGRVLLAVGRMDRGKRLDAAVSALPDVLARVPDAQLVLVGDDFGTRAALEAQAARLGLARRVHFLGFLPDEELTAAYHAAEVLVHPSGYEAFGIVLTEAMAAGTPAVARRVGGVPWVLPDGECGLLFEAPEDLARGLLRLLEDRPLARRLGEAGRERVRRHFSSDRALATLEALHGELLEGGS